MTTEHIEQRNAVSWFRKTYRPVRIFAVPNGGRRDKTTAIKLKAEGVSAGVPDLMVPEWKLFIEMKKDKKGRVSDKQKDWIEYLDSVGYTCLVCYGFDDFKRRVNWFYREVLTFDP